MDQVILEIKNLSFRWKDSGSQLLDIPDFKVKKHEHVFLQGPCGSGNSPLLGVIGGYGMQD